MKSRRIDNQLRGRSGRQGDPGDSKFFLSLEDDLMRIFGSERMDGMLRRLGLQEGEAIIHPWINRALEKAQQKVEARNFEARKNVLKYDDVMNDQRKVIFEQRIELMHKEEVGETVADMRRETVEELVGKHIPANAYAEQWDVQGLHDAVKNVFDLDLPIIDWSKEEGIADQEIRERIAEKVDAAAARKAAELGPDLMRQIEKGVLLQTLDQLWREHLIMLEHLRQAVGLRGYAQRDPLNEYKSESFTLFEAMLARLRMAVTEQLMHVQLAPQQSFEHGDERPAGNVRLARQSRQPARTNSKLPKRRPAPMDRCRANRAPAAAAAARRRSVIAALRLRPIRRTRAHGARSRATRPAPAARARSSSIATARW